MQMLPAMLSGLLLATLVHEASAQEKASLGDCQAMATASINLNVRLSPTPTSYEQILATREGQAAYNELMNSCRGFTKTQAQQMAQCADNAKSQIAYNSCIARLAQSQSQPQPAAPKVSPERESLCHRAIEKQFMFAIQDDPDIVDKNSFMNAMRQSPEYSETLRLCMTELPEDIAQCLANAKSPQAADACTEEDEPINAIKASREECSVAVERLFRLEFMADPETAPQVEMYLKAAKSLKDYRDAIDDCTRHLTPAAARCITQAKTAKEADRCTD